MKRYPYDPDRVKENKAGYERITEKQLLYIIDLCNDRSDEEVNAVFESIPEWKTECDYDPQKLSKGQAMFVIKCFLGQIKPIAE